MLLLLSGGSGVGAVTGVPRGVARVQVYYSARNKDTQTQ